MRHLFSFLKQEIVAKDNVLDQASLEEERRCAELTNGMLASQVSDKAREISILNILGVKSEEDPELLDVEIEAAEREVELLEQQLQVREKQENMLRLECREVETKIEALER